jgi:hypothetical protein
MLGLLHLFEGTPQARLEKLSGSVTVVIVPTRRSDQLI